MKIEQLKQIIKSWYYSDKAFGWAIDEDEFIEDLCKHIINNMDIQNENIKKTNS